VRTIDEVMTKDVFTVTPETPLKEVAKLLVDYRISGVPVVDAGVVVGVVSEADLLIKEAGDDGIAPRRPGWLRGGGHEADERRSKIAATDAGHAMTRPAVSGTPDMPLATAAALMTERHVNRLPVIQDGRLVGIVTRADLIRSFVRSDDEIAATIGDEVLRRVLWLDPASFVVTVHDGIVSISGEVDRRSTAEAIETAVAFVEGVVAVEAFLPWSFDDRVAEPVSYDPVFPFGPR
jgi:CBS domain-containing protein